MTNDVSSPVSIRSGLSSGARSLKTTARTLALYWIILFIANVLVGYIGGPGFVFSASVGILYPQYFTVALTEALVRTTAQLPIILTLGWALVRLNPKIKNQLDPFPNQTSLLQTSLEEQIYSTIKHRAQLSITETASMDRLLVMREIDDRVKLLRERANLIFAAIAGALITAALVVVFAGRLTGLDAAAVSNIDKAKAELTDAQRTLARAYKYSEVLNELDDLKKKRAAALDRDSISSLDKQMADKVKEYAALRDLNSLIRTLDTVVPETSSSAQAMITTAAAHVTSLTELLGQIEKSELTAEHGYGDWRYLAATAITRVGVVLIIVFLVQILMGLYRYNTRLITYYNSRRDLLTIWQGDQKKLHALDTVLAPPTFDFGKDPKHPLEDIIRAVGAHMNKSDSAGHQHKPSKGKDKEESE